MAVDARSKFGSVSVRALGQNKSNEAGATTLERSSVHLRCKQLIVAVVKSRRPYSHPGYTRVLVMMIFADLLHPGEDALWEGWVLDLDLEDGVRGVSATLLLLLRVLRVHFVLPCRLG